MTDPDDLKRYKDREKRLAYLREYRSRPENMEKKRAYQRERYKDQYWRERTKQQSLAARSKWKIHLQPIIEEALSSGCSRCQEADRRCLQFHHRDPSQKLFTVGAYLTVLKVGDGDDSFEKRKKVLRDEVAKCDVLCANCHFKLHAEDGKFPHNGRR